MTQLARILPLLFAWAMPSLPQPAIAQTVIGGFSHCEAFERSLLLVNRQNALLAEVRQALLEFDRQQALKPGAVDATGVNSPHCERLRELLNNTETSEAALSTALAEFPVLVTMNSNRQPPMAIIANVPGLAAWSGRPLVTTAQFDQADWFATQRSESIVKQIRIAADFTQSLNHFFAGDRTAASSARPSPDDLEPLPRAWLTGVPTMLKSSGLFGTAEEAIYDALPRTGGDDAYALIGNVANGKISPTAALRLSIPANNVQCIGADTPGDVELLWAGLVSGYWGMSNDDRSDPGLQKTDPIGRIEDIVAQGRTCFDATLHPLLEGRHAERRALDILTDLDTLVGSTLRDAHSPSGRTALAREILAAIVAQAIMQAEIDRDDNEGGSSPERTELYLAECQDTDTVKPDPLVALLTAVDPRPASPLEPLLAISRARYASPSSEKEVSTLKPSILHVASYWMAATELLPNLLYEGAAKIDPALARQVRARYSRRDNQNRIKEIVDLLLNSGDRKFIALADELRDELHVFSLQSQVAIQLASRRILRVASSVLFGGKRLDGYQRDEVRAYSRLIELFPKLADQTFLARLYRSSQKNSIHVAGLDILHSIHDQRGIEVAITKLPAERNPWLRFAPDLYRLPEQGIPAIDNNPGSGAALVAMSAAMHALSVPMATNDDKRAWRGAASRLVGPLVVGLDMLHQQTLGRDPDNRYAPSETAREVYAGVMASDLLDDAVTSRDKAADEELSLNDLVAKLPLLQLLWNKAIRPFAENNLAEDRDSATARLLLNDIELVIGLVTALLDPRFADSFTIAEEIDNRLQQDPDWPLPLQRLAARLALELLSEPAETGGQINDHNRKALLAEFDAYFPHAAQQNLIDAGFLPAALSRIPLRVLLAARSAGSITKLTEQDIIAVFTDELTSFDYRIAAREGPLREITEIVLALIESSSQADTLAGLGAMASEPAGAAILKLISHAVKVKADITPSPKARAFGDLRMLNGMIDAIDEAPEHERNMLAARALKRVVKVATTCPRMKPSLIPLKTSLQRRAGMEIEPEQAMSDLRDLVLSGDRNSALTVRINVDFIGSITHFGITQGAPAYPAGVHTGNLIFDTGIGSLDDPWRIHSTIGVGPGVDESSLGLAVALELSESSADMGQTDRLAGQLVLLETILVGGNPFAGKEGRTANFEPVEPDFTRRFFGVPIGSALPLAERLKGIPQAANRLLRLAAFADHQGLYALARRIAGIATAAAMEAYAVEETDDEERTAEETAAIEALAESAGMFTYRPGYLLSREIALGRMAVPEAYVAWALCHEPGLADDIACRSRSHFAMPASGPAEEPSLATPHTNTVPACEMMARAILANQLLANSKMDDSCLHGPMRIDYEALVNASAMRDVFTYAGLGFAPAHLVLNPTQVLNLLRAAPASESAPLRTRLYTDAAKVALSTGNLEVSYQLALLRLAAEIVDPENTHLGAISRNAAVQFQERIPDRQVAQMLQRLSLSGSKISEADRKLSKEVIQVILGD